MKDKSSLIDLPNFGLKNQIYKNYIMWDFDGTPFSSRESVGTFSFIQTLRDPKSKFWRG